MSHKPFEYASLILLALTAIVLLALQIKLLGFIILGFGIVSLFFCRRDFRKNILLIFLCLALLGITPINTDTNYPHTLQMGIPLFLVVFIPYLVTKYIYKNSLVRFPLHHGRSWHLSEVLYIVITAAIAYVLLPIMLRDTGSYLNWTILPGWYELTESYIGLNAVGIWDELFFVSTVLGILRNHLEFKWANLTQAIIFTSFLYTLGFQGWSFIIIFIFALVQGYIFKRTESLLYVLAIHLTFDLILHVTLIYLHHPEWLPIFIT
ncbi:MAG: CPBP family intramembrane metalloprotease [Candidatus Levybacteria bacterium]|nr:CPBP family intramembrane metalloprotease [Candidatus Levybacteria bacterium]